MNNARYAIGLQTDTWMANKRRPKKTKPPYRHYVYRSTFTEDKETPVSTADGFKPEDLTLNSVYVLQQQAVSGQLWPRSQFEKVDLLAASMHGNLQESLATPQGMTLPIEIMMCIFDILHHWGYLKPKHLRLSKLLYHILVPLIYRCPVVRGNNFFGFVDTVTTTKLGGYIKDLDLSHVNHLGKNAYVAKLLRRSRDQLEAFTASQTSFGLGPLIALRGCEQLKVLDLRLVSETLNLEELFHLIRDLNKLTHLLFPRSSLEISNYDNVRWPPELQFLRVSGGISDDFLIKAPFPETIAHIEFAHCPKVGHLGLRHFLHTVGRHLKSLRVQFPMPGLQPDSLDTVFKLCPNLSLLEISVDYTQRIFDDDMLSKALGSRLRALYIDSSGMLGTNDKIDPLDLAVALGDERLPLLRNVRCTAKLGWNPKSDYVLYIADTLDERGGGLYIGY